MTLRSLCLLLLALAGSAGGQTSDAVLNAWLSRQASLHSLESRFVQERKLPSLKNPTITPGKLSFRKPAAFRWQLGEPPESEAVSDGNVVTLLDGATRTARRFAANSPRAARFSLLSGSAFQSRTAFDRHFDIIDSRVVSGIHQFTLKPKDRRFRSEVPWVFLDIDPAKNELRAMELELQDKSRVRTIFQQVVFNKKLPDALFQPNLSGYLLK